MMSTKSSTSQIKKPASSSNTYVELNSKCKKQCRAFNKVDKFYNSKVAQSKENSLFTVTKKSNSARSVSAKSSYDKDLCEEYAVKENIKKMARLVAHLEEKLKNNELTPEQFQKLKTRLSEFESQVESVHEAYVENNTTVARDARATISVSCRSIAQEVSNNDSTVVDQLNWQELKTDLLNIKSKILSESERKALIMKLKNSETEFLDNLAAEIQYYETRLKDDDVPKAERTLMKSLLAMLREEWNVFKPFPVEISEPAELTVMEIEESVDMNNDDLKHGITDLIAAVKNRQQTKKNDQELIERLQKAKVQNQKNMAAEIEELRSLIAVYEGAMNYSIANLKNGLASGKLTGKDKLEIHSILKNLQKDLSELIARKNDLQLSEEESFRQELVREITERSSSTELVNKVKGAEVSELMSILSDLNKTVSRKFNDIEQLLASKYQSQQVCEASVSVKPRDMSYIESRLAVIKNNLKSLLSESDARITAKSEMSQGLTVSNAYPKQDYSVSVSENIASAIANSVSGTNRTSIKSQKAVDQVSPRLKQIGANSGMTFTDAHKPSKNNVVVWDSTGKKYVVAYATKANDSSSCDMQLKVSNCAC